VDHIAAYTGGLNAQVSWLGLRVAGRRPPGTDLHLSDEPGELSQ